MSVARTFARKMKITATTRPMVISSVFSRSATAARMVTVRSISTAIRNAGGIAAWRAGSSALMRATVSITLAPGILKIGSTIAGRPRRPGHAADILDAVDRRANVPDPDWRAIAVCDDHVVQGFASIS